MRDVRKSVQRDHGGSALNAAHGFLLNTQLSRNLGLRQPASSARTSNGCTDFGFEFLNSFDPR